MASHGRLADRAEVRTARPRLAANPLVNYSTSAIIALFSRRPSSSRASKNALR